MMRTVLFLAALLLITIPLSAEDHPSPRQVPAPTPAQIAWQQAELGVVIHYDLHVFDDKHYSQGKNRRVAYPDPDIFNPVDLDTDQWVRTARDLGAKFAIFTASHETGFRMWQSDATPEYSLKAVKWGDGKRDIVAEFIASCRKYGIAPGIYLGTRWNSHHQVLDFKPTQNATITLEDYNKRIEAEVTEICTRYGDLFELWFDGGAHGPRDGGPDVLGIFEKHQKNCLFYHNYQRADARWGGSESGTVPYPCWATMPFDGYEGHKKVSHAKGFRLLKHGDPEGRFWCPAMSDAPLRNHEWFWDEGDERKIRPLKSMVNMIYNSTGRNSTLIVGLTPDNRGLIPEADARRCREVGAEMKRLFSNKLASTSGTGSTLVLDLGGKKQVNQLVVQEDIARGERVREHSIDYFADGTWHPLATGTCIGHKRILRFKPVTATKLRLRITKSTAEPVLSNFSAYLTTGKP
jgi:alpha-L-fucosidase